MNILKHMIVLLTVLPVSLSALGQWSDDPAQNTVISDAPGAKYVPKICAAPDGNFFISWYGGSGNLNMNLQLLDFNGYALWQENGMAVSTHPQNSWVTDYSLAVDTTGNAIVAFTDVRNGHSATVVYKVSQNGEMLLGEDGFMPVPSGNEDLVATVTVLKDNAALVAWMRNSDTGMRVQLQKIADDGSLPWGEDGIMVSDATADIQNPVPVPLSDGGFILVYYLQTGNFPAAIRKIHAMRYNADGQTVWAQPVEVCGNTGISPWATLQVISDLDDGVVVAWYDDPQSNNLSNVAVQHVLSDGSLDFPVNGLVVGKDDGNINNFIATPALINEYGDIYVYWTFTNSNQSLFGLRGQKIAPGGNMLWGYAGKEIIPLNNVFGDVQVPVIHNDTSYLVYENYVEGDIQYQHLMVKVLDSAGAGVFDGDIEFSVINSAKVHPDGSEIFNNQFAVVWEDGNNGGTIRAQNLIVGDTTSNPVSVIDIPKPGPVMKLQGNFLILTAPGEISGIVITDTAGNRLHNIDKSINRIKLDEILPNGMYIIMAYGKNGQVRQVLKAVVSTR